MCLHLRGKFESGLYVVFNLRHASKFLSIRRFLSLLLIMQDPGILFEAWKMIMSSFSRSFKVCHLCYKLRSHFFLPITFNLTQRSSNFVCRISLFFKSSNCISKLPILISKGDNFNAVIVALRRFLLNSSCSAVFKFLKPADKCLHHI